MKILFVRHGETNLNNPRRMQGISDNELNENGIKQANIVKKIINNEDVDLIIVSPLKRAMQTAEIINSKINKKIIIDDRIKEMDYGLLEGEIYSKDYWNMGYDYKSINGENILDFQERIYKFIEDIKVKYKNKNILIVSHGGVARIFRCYFEGIPEDRNLADYGIANCEIKEFKI